MYYHLIYIISFNPKPKIFFKTGVYAIDKKEKNIQFNNLFTTLGVKDSKLFF